ncbi:MAG TPA: methyltransferase domain-containing protein [Candidatus Paceibacterota bacterium]|nr:methyltransferase domain-containing protein [Candidatus Paceibacterota bacterium]
MEKLQPEMEIKLAYISGLREVVLCEVEQNTNLELLQTGTHSSASVGDATYLKFSPESLVAAKHSRSAVRVYVVVRDRKFHPAYIFKHKFVLARLVETVKNAKDAGDFKSFKITCTGKDSPEVRGVAKYISETYGLPEKEEADLKIHIIKLGEVWEVGVEATARPLSVREYKVAHMSGAMNPTIAYTVNSLAGLETATSYLNVFSGSGTLLIEAAESFPHLQKLVGFDQSKKHLSLAVQNLKKARLMQKVELKEGNVFKKPDFGMFDAITSDLPFGMAVSKGEDLEALYKTFVEYCEEKLNSSGRLVVYTSAHEILRAVLSHSKFEITKTFDLKIVTSVDAYLRPKIFVCKFQG